MRRETPRKAGMLQITYHGSEADIQKAIDVLKKIKNLRRMKEGKARQKVQALIDEHKVKASILINGNSVWSRIRILRNLRRIIKEGTLYNAKNQRKPPILSHYFYEFLHQCCGSIAHYDIYGWIHKYPTIRELKRFFKKNELGKRVSDDIPGWETDAKLIVEEIEHLLFPFETYMQVKAETLNHS